MIRHISHKLVVLYILIWTCCVHAEPPTKTQDLQTFSSTDLDELESLVPEFVSIEKSTVSSAPTFATPVSAELPWLVKLRMNSVNGQAWLCGGTLINENFVVTAAHCVAKNTLDHVVVNFMVYVDGTRAVWRNKRMLQTTNNKIIVPKKNVIVHERYDEANVVHDLALLELPSSACELFYRGFNYPKVSQAPIHLNNPQRPKQQEIYTVAGWGMTEHGRNAVRLSEVKLNLLKPGRCRHLAERSDWFDGDSQFCLYGKKADGQARRQDACQGDSGGPVYILTSGGEKVTMYGTVSFGPADCGGKVPGVYTKIDHYGSWIDKHVKHDASSARCTPTKVQRKYPANAASRSYGGQIAVTLAALIVYMHV